MSYKEHIYVPASDALEQRVVACQDSFRLRDDTEIAFDLISDPQWLDRIGSFEDVLYASYVANNSLIRATSSLHKDINQIREYKLLDEKEIQALEAIWLEQEKQQSLEDDLDIDLSL